MTAENDLINLARGKSWFAPSLNKLERELLQAREDLTLRGRDLYAGWRGTRLLPPGNWLLI